MDRARIRNHRLRISRLEVPAAGLCRRVRPSRRARCRPTAGGGHSGDPGARRPARSIHVDTVAERRGGGGRIREELAAQPDAVPRRALGGHLPPHAGRSPCHRRTRQLRYADGLAADRAGRVVDSLGRRDRPLIGDAVNCLVNL